MPSEVNLTVNDATGKFDNLVNLIEQGRKEVAVRIEARDRNLGSGYDLLKVAIAEEVLNVNVGKGMFLKVGTVDFVDQMIGSSPRLSCSFIVQFSPDSPRGGS